MSSWRPSKFFIYYVPFPRYWENRKTVMAAANTKLQIVAKPLGQSCSIFLCGPSWWFCTKWQGQNYVEHRLVYLQNLTIFWQTLSSPFISIKTYIHSGFQKSELYHQHLEGRTQLTGLLEVECIFKTKMSTFNAFSRILLKVYHFSLSLLLCLLRFVHDSVA